MEKLPELRIVVKPYDGFYKKWRWAVQKKRFIKNHEWWADILSDRYSSLAGYTRTQEQALVKARKAAADHCEYLLEVRQHKNALKAGTIIEKVTCQEEPV